MKNFKQRIRLIIVCMVLFFIAQGCVAKKDIVELMPEIKEPVACRDMLFMDTASIPDDDFMYVLDHSYENSEFHECWKPLMKKAIQEGRGIPMKHLARAVHVFNRNDSKDEFSLVVYLYFKEIINGNGSYRGKDKKLLAEYLSFTISNSQSKQDKSLEKAKLVCSRLDPGLYGKFFR
ncbi:MAG: hypothetical protein PF503_14795 [Desulfobacula sp.]|nr:hypothetical protein [Desulfobacula sp.]